jgi:integrase
MAQKGSKRGAPGSGSMRKKTIVRNGVSYIYWEARITTGYDLGTGKQIQRSFSGKTQREVRQKMQAAQVALDSHQYQEPTNMTLGEWLEIWEKEYLNGVKPFTKLNYSQHIKNHIRPALENCKLQKLSGPDIQRFYNLLLREGGRTRLHDKEGRIVKKDGQPVYVPAPLSAKTVKNIHGVLHKALEQAVKVGCIRTNPADSCELSKVEKKEIRPLNDEDISRFMEAVQDHPFRALFLTTLFTGMRRGEVCGLRWDCVNLDNGTITINKQIQNVPGQPGAYRLVSTKNGKSRTLKASRFVVDLLRQQKAEQEKMKQLVGELWHDEGYVFCNAMGEHLSPSTVYHNFKRIASNIGMPTARLHDLRHSYAVASLQAGDDIKTVQSNLGHHTAAFTLDVYGHVIEQMKQASADRMDAYIRTVSEAKRENEREN